jgi:hypothetical protein
MSHLWPIVAMLFGVITHILKKAMKLRFQNSSFDLSDYLIGHPYQTALTFIAGAGCYLSLMEAGGAPSLAAAFFAGVAANSLGDIAPGER